MRAPFKLLGVAAAASLAFGAGAARADVFVYADATKFKTVSVFKTVNVNKTVSVSAIAEVPTDATSEQDIFANQRNQFNFAEDEDGQATNTITGSFVGASGEQATIQNNGYNNNNLNSDSLSYSNSPSGTATGTAGVFTDAEVNLQQINGATDVVDIDSVPVAEIDNGATFVNSFAIVSGLNYSNDITDSFTDAAGVAKTIQENGSNNNNFNGVAIALGDFSVFALDEVNAGQFSNFNMADVVNAIRTNTISGSFGGYDGIAATIQNNGANTNNANTSAFSASLTNPPAPGSSPVGGL